MEINFLRLIHPEIKTIHTSEDKQNGGTIPMPTFAGRPSATSSTTPVELPQNCMVEQQRQQISGLQFNIFPKFSMQNLIEKPSEYLSRFSHRKQCYGSKKWKMVDSLDELKSSRIRFWQGFSKLSDAGRVDCLCSEQDHPECPSSGRRSVSRSRKPKKKTGFFEEDRSPS